MGAFVTYSNLMTYILPIFCSAICSVFTLLLTWNYRNLAERKLRWIVSIYCILIAIWWSSALWHTVSDEPIFLPVDIPFALSYIYTPILFYNIVYNLTYFEDKRNFPILNYLWPVPTLVIILIVATWIFASQGRAFYRLIVVRRIYGAFHIRLFSAVYHSGSLYCSNRTIVIAALQANSTSKNRYRSKISQYKIIALAHRVFHTFHRYIANRFFVFVGWSKPMAYPAEHIMHYGSRDIAYIPNHPQAISLLQNI